MTKILICPPQIGGDCGLYVIAISIMYYLEKFSQTQDSSSLMNDPGLTDFINQHAKKLSELNSDDKFSNFLADLVDEIRGIVSYSSCLYPYLESCMEFSYDFLLEVNPYLSKVPDLKDICTKLENLPSDICLEDKEKLLRLKKEKIRSYFQMPKVWLSDDLVKSFASIFLTVNIFADNEVGVCLHNYDKDHYFIKLPLNPFTTSLLDRGWDPKVIDTVDNDVESDNPPKFSM